MRVKRVEYINKNGVLCRSRKIVLEVVEPDAYVSYCYGWSKVSNKWEPIKGTAYFDGRLKQEVGILHMKENAERYVELLTKYAGFETMWPNELNTDTSAEDEYIETCMASRVSKEGE